MRRTRGGTYYIGNQVLTPGGAITVSGTEISLASGASEVVIDGQTQRLGAHAPAVTLAGNVYTANAGSTYTIAGQTLTPDGAVTVSGTTFSLAASATALVVNGQISSFENAASPATASATMTAPPLLTIDNTPYAANPGTTYNIHSHLLSPGGTVTLSGPNGMETLSLAPSATALIEIFSGKTFTSTIAGAGEIAPTAAPVLTIGGETFVALPGNGRGEPSYVVGGATLTPGEEETVTLDGSTYIVSLAEQATVLRIETLGGGTVTATTIETLFPAPDARGTVYMTASGTGSSAGGTEGAARTSSSDDSGGAGSQSAATSLALQISGLVAAGGTLVLAVWL